MFGSPSPERTPRLGISISENDICVMVVRQQAVLYAAAERIESAMSISDSLHRLLADPALHCHGATTVRAAVGFGWSQVKRLKGLPHSDDRELIRRVVSRADGRFFRRNSVPLAIANVRLLATGEALVGAIDQHVIDVLLESCSAAGLVLEAVLPYAAALGFAIRQSCVQASDGPIAAEMHYDDAGRLCDLRSGVAITMGAPPAIEDGCLAEPLKRLGSEAPRFAAAFGATMMSGADDLALETRRLRQNPRVSNRRVAAGAIAMAIAAGTWYLAPIIASKGTADRTRFVDSAMARRYGGVRRASDSLRQITAQLHELAVFSEHRRSMTLFLASLTESLPDSVQVVSLKTDSIGGTLTILSPLSASAVADVAAMPGVDGVSLGGPVISESTGSGERQRAVIVFRWKVVTSAALPRRAFQQHGRRE